VSLAFDPEGRLLSVGFATGGSVQLLSVPTLEIERELPGHRTEVWATPFSPKGDRLITCCGRTASTLVDPDLAVRVWTRGGKLVARLQLSAKVLSGAWSPDGRRIAVGTGMGQVALVDDRLGGQRLLDGGVDSQGLSLQVLSHSGSVRGVAFSPDGRTLYTASGNQGGGELFLWDTATGARIVDQPGRPVPPQKRKYGLRGLDVSKDGQRLLTWSDEGGLELWWLGD
jgi:WD40 repeat protein